MKALSHICEGENLYDNFFEKYMDKLDSKNYDGNDTALLLSKV